MGPLNKDFFQTACFLKLCLVPPCKHYLSIPQHEEVCLTRVISSCSPPLKPPFPQMYEFKLSSSKFLFISYIYHSLSSHVSCNCLHFSKQKVVPTHSKILRNCLCCTGGLGVVLGFVCLFVFLTADIWLDKVLFYHYLTSSGHS